MFIPIFTKQFNKDLKKSISQKKKIEKFKIISSNLISGIRLEAKYKDHKLSGYFSGRRECHIEPDWIMIYKIEGNYIVFERIGTHSELF